MRCADSGAFRRALEDRLRTQSLRAGTPLVRLRKMVAFERLLARLIVDQPQAWLLKGGGGTAVAARRTCSHPPGP